MTSIRKRSGSGSAKKTPMKEKIIQMYDQLLRSETVLEPDDTFWADFFLLKPKINYLENEISKLTSEQLFAGNLRVNLNRLFEESLSNLSSDHQIRVVYALQTLCGLVRSSFRKQGSGFDLVNLLMNFEVAEARMQTLISHLNEFLVGEEPASMKELCLKLLLILCTGMENISQNTLIEYLTYTSVFESLIHLLSSAETRSVHGPIAILLLTILVQYRKYEVANAYGVKLSILDQELSLHGYGQVVTKNFLEYTQSYQASIADQTSSGWFSSITSMVGNMFVSGDEGNPKIEQMKALNSSLLSLYEAVHRNRNFIATLVHYQTETTGANNNKQPQSVSGSLSEDTSSLGPSPPGTPATEEPVINTVSSAPSNLLVTFLEYCSIVMQDTKSESSANTVKLSFLILLCVTEDQYANSLMHDSNLVYSVRLHCLPMRHRKTSSYWDHGTPISRPLATAVMDLMVEFIRSHMMKRFPHELYGLCLSIVHRLLAYEKRFRVRLTYPWKELWTALIGLIKFVTSNESSLGKKINLFSVALQTTVIFNLFITYGDTFLASPSSYDELYYELVRCHSTFDSLYSMALRYSTGGGEFKESAVRVTNSLVNIRAITAHFCPKIDAWLAQQQVSTPSEEEILEVVKGNYDSLTLKLQDGLDHYERYTESPKHCAFFTTLVRGVIADAKHQVVLQDLELQTVLQDFSSIQ